jgi:hypothetical protein
MRHVVLVLSSALLSLGALGGCPSPRTTAATRPSPTAFQPASSDPKAIELVDAAWTALNAGTKWSQVKELRFDVRYSANGAVQARYQHRWDLWNGRHALKTANMSTTGNREEDVRWHDVRYDIFDKNAIFWSSYAKQADLPSDVPAKVEAARLRLQEDGYHLTIIYKLKDPGVHLAATGGLAPSAGVCEPSCNTVKVTFDPEVGTDTWYVHFNKNTNLPEIIEQETAKGRLGYRLSNWVDAGGLKWPTLFTNVGLAGETYEFSNIAVGDPKDGDYAREL